MSVKYICGDNTQLGTKTAQGLGENLQNTGSVFQQL